MLAVAALAASGVLAILLVFSRTPGLARLVPVADFFRTALVAHVDLSVLVWFIASGGVAWSLSSRPRAIALGWQALVLTAAGSVVIALAPFFGGTAIMANYIPVIDSPAFIAGLVLVGVGALLLVVRGLVTAAPPGTRLDGAGSLRFGLNGALIAAAVALLAFAWSWFQVPDALEPKAFYELLFWGGGHVLQFSWTLLLLVAWLLLADASGLKVPLSPRVVTMLFGIGLAAVFVTPLIYLAFDIASVEHHRLQTWLMRFGGGLAIGPVAAGIVLAVLTQRRRVGEGARPLRAALLTSLALFAFGGLVGFAIDGNNVRVPAHYHGCIVSVTVALMGLTYWLLPRLALGRPRVRLAIVQCYCYGVGQALHITGLVWSGGYGVQRKVADGALAQRSLEETIGMGVMGLGGLVAVVGGLLFVIVVVLAVAGQRRACAVDVRAAAH